MDENAAPQHLLALLRFPNPQVWVQAIGRALYQTGYGLIQFYIPIIFVKQVGLSATAVGIGIGVGSLAGVLGHLLGGYLADSPAYGRKRTLVFSAVLSLGSAIALTCNQTLPMLVVSNLLLGLSAGCYWTAADAAVIDVTPADHRQTAFAVLVLADSLGSGIGVLGGGLILAWAHQVQSLFLSASLIFLLFWGLVQFTVIETRQDLPEQPHAQPSLRAALTDQALQLFVLSNLFFTTYIALVNSTLPLYFTNLMAPPADASLANGSVVSVANLFTWCYIGVGAVLQLPIVQMFRGVAGIRVLMVSLLLWSGGFGLVWAAGLQSSMPVGMAIAAFSILSIATAIYKPFAPAIVAELAPSHLRAVYLAISYQCWSVGYFVGPILGGWVLDQPAPIMHYAWLVVGISSLCGLAALYSLARYQAHHLTQVVRDAPTPIV